MYPSVQYLYELQLFTLVRNFNSQWEVYKNVPSVTQHWWTVLCMNFEVWPHVSIEKCVFKMTPMKVTWISYVSFCCYKFRWLMENNCEADLSSLNIMFQNCLGVCFQFWWVYFKNNDALLHIKHRNISKLWYFLAHEVQSSYN